MDDSNESALLQEWKASSPRTFCFPALLFLGLEDEKVREAAGSRGQLGKPGPGSSVVEGVGIGPYEQVLP